jgi:hypothetical protein
MLINSYFVESFATGAVEAGACLLASGAVGIVVLGAEPWSSPNILESVAAFPPLKLKLDNKIRAISIPPKVQVLLSKKSVVF